MQCIQRYQQALNNKLAKTTEWTKEEDDLLRKGAEIYGSKNWQNVANMISGRSAVQCGAKYRKSSKCRDDIVDGSWLEIDERRLFLGAVVYEIPTSSVQKKTNAEIDAFLNDEIIVPNLAPTTGLTNISQGENVENNRLNNPSEIIINQKGKKKYNLTKVAPSIVIPPVLAPDSADVNTDIEGQDVDLNSVTAKVKNNMSPLVIKENHYILLSQ